ncbi:hypothetical protein P43SY_004655 [Pythium insidiosum]|uniref:Alpha/beta hydrolase fold-3 domain-containing protein n=1 Tax=Pythium insidiosum TaxID=114742 RepID=A0AAD5LB75_PYTIN|nr:hypothetical protein P43SY_004655 [Pythium insidiosum]
MVLVHAAKSALQVKPRQSLRSLQSHVLALLLTLNPSTFRRLVLRVAVGGSIYALYIQAAELDHVYAHSVRLHEKAQQHGLAHWQLDVHENLPHVFSVFPSSMLPSAAVGLDAMAAFATKQYRQSLCETAALGS